MIINVLWEKTTFTYVTSLNSYYSLVKYVILFLFYKMRAQSHSQ